jgi:histone H3/H4
LNQQDWQDDEFQEVATRDNMRNMAEYRVSAKCTDDLTNADVEIGVQVFEKTSLTILLNSRQINRLSMRK